MNQTNPNNNPDGSGDVPWKRKRGRPQKYPSSHVEENAYIPNVQNINQNPVSGENDRVTPGFERVNRNQPCRRDLENYSNDPLVGQMVSCVIEAVFDAGYLLSVKVGNSDTTLRGLVFKPGRYAPISAENDVAPGVPMIQRNPFSTGTYTQAQNPRQKERNKQYVNIHRNETRIMKGSPSVSQLPRGAVSSSNLVASQGKNVPSMAEQATHPLAKSNVVPVVLQPINSSNGLLVSSQSSQVMTQASLGSGSAVTKEIPADGIREPFSQIQTSQNMLSRGMQYEDGPHNQSSAEVLHKVEVESMRLPGGMPFEKLVTEVIKRIQAPSESMDTETGNSKSGDKMLVKDSSSMQEDKVNDVGQPLLIKPLQAVQAAPLEHSVSASRPSKNSKTGKMTDLLQDYTIENQASEAEELPSGHQLDGIRNFETELDGKTDELTKLS